MIKFLWNFQIVSYKITKNSKYSVTRKKISVVYDIQKKNYELQMDIP